MVTAGTIMANGRFFDYYGIGVIFLAGSCISYLSQIKFNFDEKLKKFLIIGVLFFLLISGTSTFINIKREIYSSDYSAIKKVAEWIKSKSEEKDKVYLYRWDYFSLAFFYNDKNTYSMGMEPMQLFYYNKKLYWKWYNIHNHGIYCDKEEDCSSEAGEYSNSLKNASDDQKKLIIKENGRKIIKSIKDDFDAKFVITAETSISDIFESNEDLINDSFEAKSSINEGKAWGYKLR